jgi:AbrB family looped-hinge helix DNA binding protein
MRVTSRGQVTIPKHLRQRTGIKAGSEVDFAEQRGEVVIRKSATRRRRPASEEDFAAWLDRVRGSVDLGMSTDEFMELLRGE